MTSENISLKPNAAVLFIEFQHEWVTKSGTLRKKLIDVDVDVDTAIENAKSLLKTARQSNSLICHITMQPDKNYRVFGQALYGLRAAIPKAETWQNGMQNIHSDFFPLDNEITIHERTGASAFSGTMLDSVLRNNKVDTLYLAGFATHVCVESTLREAHDKGYTCYVVNDATAAFTRAQQAYFESNIVHHFGQSILSQYIQ
jgi:nicotinamidase-related amidase